MFNTKKAIEMSFNTIVIAAICLIVLVVIILVFTGQIGDVAKGFAKIREQETDKSILEKGLFGCDDGSKKCIGNTVYTCENADWVKGPDCSGRCEGGACI